MENWSEEAEELSMVDAQVTPLTKGMTDLFTWLAIPFLDS